MIYHFIFYFLVRVYILRLKELNFLKMIFSVRTIIPILTDEHNYLKLIHFHNTQVSLVCSNLEKTNISTINLPTIHIY
jgi:hypothetical protein